MYNVKLRKLKKSHHQFMTIYRVTDEKPLMLYLAYFLSDLNK
jgi:hypothetical protein